MISDSLVPLDPVIDQLKERERTARLALGSLHVMQQEAQEASPKLEAPEPVLAYIDSFIDMFEHGASECGRIAAALSVGIRPADVKALDAIVDRARREAARCVGFRDKWINKPLYHEQVRPLLNRIADLTRREVTAFRQLETAVTRLAGLMPPPPNSKQGPESFDRRSLFTRWFRPSDDGEAT